MALDRSPESLSQQAFINDAWLLTGEDGALHSVAETCRPGNELIEEALAKTNGVPGPLAQQKPLLNAIGSLLGT